MAPLLAALAAGCGVWGAWEGLGALEDAAPLRRVAHAVAPLWLAGRVGHEPTPPERRRLGLLGAGTLLVAGWLVAGPLLGAVMAAGGPFAIGRLIAWRRRRWRTELTDGAPLMARAMADALAGGHGIRGALDEVARGGGLTGPAAQELRDVARRLALGEPTDHVLERLRVRAGSAAWDALVAAILLQREAGGDLSALLRSLAASQEHARRVEGEARGLTSQARATARLVGGLPLAGLALGELASPGMLAGLLGDPRSRLLLIGAAATGAVAMAVIGRLARVGDA